MQVQSNSNPAPRGRRVTKADIDATVREWERAAYVDGDSGAAERLHGVIARQHAERLEGMRLDRERRERDELRERRRRARRLLAAAPREGARA